MIKEARRWEFTIIRDGEDGDISVTSIDGDSENVKLSVMGLASGVVGIDDLIDLLERVKRMAAPSDPGSGK